MALNDVYILLGAGTACSGQLICNPNPSIYPCFGPFMTHIPPGAGITVAVDPANPPIVQAFHGGHWGGWTFEVNGSTTKSDGSLELSFRKGGFQEARSVFPLFFL